MVRDIAVELRRRKHQAEGAERGLSMAELNVEAMKVGRTRFFRAFV